MYVYAIFVVVINVVHCSWFVFSTHWVIWPTEMTFVLEVYNDCVMCTWCWVSRMILELCIPSVWLLWTLCCWHTDTLQSSPTLPLALWLCAPTALLCMHVQSRGRAWLARQCDYLWVRRWWWQQSQSWCQSHAYVHTHIHYSKRGNEFRCVMVLCQLLNIWLSLL